MKKQRDTIEIIGAREHNLKNINIKLPRNKLIVFTGISGSGKSSLAFDTIYAEGQRRYLETFGGYARSFIGDMVRPDVDKIEGLSPVIAIEQKTTSRNPRSTVGTVTEIYDFLRLLYARVGEAYSYLSGKKMVKKTSEEIIELLLSQYSDQNISLLSPTVKGRKGHYRELFVKIRKMGFTKVRIDGEIEDLVPKMQLDRYKTHDIEIVIDRIVVTAKNEQRIRQSVVQAIRHGNGTLMVIDEEKNITFFSKNLMDPENSLSYDDPAPNTFSFNSPYGACLDCKGLGKTEEISLEAIIPDKKKSISRGGIVPLGEYRDIWIFKKIEAILKRYDYHLTSPIGSIADEVIQILLYGDTKPVAVKSVKYPGEDWHTKFEGIITFLEKQREMSSEKIQSWVKEFSIEKICPTCEGLRLKKESLHFKIDDKNISEVAILSIDSLVSWIKTLPQKLDQRKNVIAKEIIKELDKRVHFLIDVGLNYLTLDRSLKTLSGGEAQRIRLATQIGTQLINVLYILDEPSIGLHQRDNIKLIQALRALRDLGNTILVVEHDKDMMLAADMIVDVGPGAGRHGGYIVACAPPKQFLSTSGTTARYLRGELKIGAQKTLNLNKQHFLELRGASGHNLKTVDLKIPLGNLVLVTGVSGSGKSTLIHETLYPLLKQKIYKSQKKPLAYHSIRGETAIDKIIEVDQSPIGRTPRSNPATYTGIFGDIRILYSQIPEAKIRNYQPGRFSFNVKGGRCETCGGGGMKVVEMDFLENIQVLCETCKGKRYNRETLEVRFKGKSISDVLDMTVNQALDFFDHQPKIVNKLKTLSEVGLGYITLGQHATTLSGGEAQRVKLASELSKKDTGKTFYILDEPTTGLHFQDIEHLLAVTRKIVAKGNTVLIIEHNMDVIKAADYIIDLGPEGGEKGGKIVAQGIPEEIIKVKQSHTAQFLKIEMAS